MPASDCRARFTAWTTALPSLIRLMTMGEANSRQPRQTRCEACGRAVPNYDIVNYGSPEKGNRALCTQCFNTEIARLDGLTEFEHVTLEPVSLTDCSGRVHEFHFRTRLLGAEIAMDAFELHDGEPGGYRFQFIGDADEDVLALVGTLIERIKRRLSIRHVSVGDSGLQITDQRILRGSIEWGESTSGSVPALNIDGRRVTWEEFGRMMMTFEGWQFKLEIRDKSEDL